MCVLRRAGSNVTQRIDTDRDRKRGSLRILNVRLVDASGVMPGIHRVDTSGVMPGIHRVDTSGVMPGIHRVDIVDGKIRQIAPMGTRPDDVADELDACGRTLMPAFIDLHAHFRDPGYPEKETLESGCRAALAGGYTTVSVMANTQPVCDSALVASDVASRARTLGWIDVLPVGAITERLEGRRLADLDRLAEHVWAFSDDGRGVQSLELAEQAFAAAARLNRPIFEHCETDGVDDPDRSEERMAARDLRLATRFGSRLHIAHVRSVETQSMVARARKQGVPVSCEVTPHHLCLDQALGYRVNPPLTGEQARATLVDAVRTGEIDAIATDHAPHTEQDKRDGAPGISGIETAFSLLYTELVRTGMLTLAELSRAMSAGPARLLGLQRRRGLLAQGMDADLVIIDERASWKVTAESLSSKGKNTPLLGRTLQGRVWATIRGGSVMVCDGVWGGRST